MFEVRRQIVWIQKKKVVVKEVVLGKTPTVVEKGEWEWSWENLTEVLREVKKQNRGKVRMLIDDSFVYVLTVEVPGNVTIEKVKLAISELIPEDLDQTEWDYKQMGEGKMVQVVALNGELNGNLSKAVKAVGIQVEAVEPVSYALARLVARQKEPVAVVYQNNLVVIVSRELVVMVETVEDGSKGKVIDFVKEKYEMEVAKVMVAENEQLNPVVGLAIKQDLRGNDEKVLNLEMKAKGESRTKNPPAERAGLEFKKEEKRETSPVGMSLAKIVIIVVLVVISVGQVGWYLSKQNKKPTKTISKVISPTVTVSLVVTTSPTTEVVNLKRYQVSILNGSGVAGEAGTLGEWIMSKGFKVGSMGNAKGYDYQETEISYGSKIDQNFRLALNRAVREKHVFVEKEPDGSQKEDEVVIIIGKKKI